MEPTPLSSTQFKANAIPVGKPKEYEPSEDYHILKLPRGEQFRLFKSMSPKRLEEETFFEYKMRRKYINDALKKYKQKKK